MKKLLIISLNSDPILSYGTEHNGGQSKYILELGKNLVRKDWNIDIFTIKNSDGVLMESITEGFNIYRFPLPKGTNYSYNIEEKDIDFISMSIHNFININKKDYNIILCCYWLSGLVGMVLKKTLNKNTLISFCSLGFFKMQATGESSSLKRRIKYERIIAKELDHIIATSNEEKKILINEYLVDDKKITVIPRGIHSHNFFKVGEI